MVHSYLVPLPLPGEPFFASCMDSESSKALTQKCLSIFTPSMLTLVLTPFIMVTPLCNPLALWF